MAFSQNAWSYTWGTAYVNMTVNYAGADDNYVYYDAIAEINTVNCYQYGFRLYLQAPGYDHQGVGYRPYSAGVVVTLGWTRMQFARGASDYTVGITATGVGETVSGYGGYWGSAATAQHFTVPRKAEASVPPAPTVVGTDNTRTVTCPAVTNGKSYVLYSSYDSGVTWTSLGAVSAGVAKVVQLLPNSAVKFRYTASGPNGVVKTGAQSPITYTVPAAPDGLTATANLTEVSLAWSVNAVYATSIILQRASDENFTKDVVTVYEGVPKSTHVGTPPPGLNFYRVAAIGPSPYGQTGWSNIASVQTMTSPTPPLNFRRTDADTDVNTIALGWENTPSLIGPYSSVDIEVSSTGVDNWTHLVSLSGMETAHTYQGDYAQKRWFRIKSANAAGGSDWVIAGPFYTKITDPIIFAEEPLSAGSTPSISTSFSFPETPGLPDPKSVTYSVTPWKSSDGESWVALATVQTQENLFTLFTIPSLYQFYKFTVVATLSGWDEGDRVSNEVGSNSVLVSGGTAEPFVSFNKETLTTTVVLPSDPWRKHSPTKVSVSVNGVETWSSSTSSVAEVQWSFHIQPPSSHFEMSVEAQSSFYNEPIEGNSLTVDLDSTQILIDGARYLAYLIYPDGTSVPCGVATVP